MNLIGVKPKKQVFFPEQLFHQHYVGELRGVFFAAPKIFNVIAESAISDDYSIIGEIYENSPPDNMIERLIGWWDDGTLHFTYDHEQYEVKFYNLYQNIFSRNTGIYNFSYIKYYNFIQLVLSFGKYVVLWGILVLANMAIKRVAIKPFLLAIITCLYENYLYYWIGAGDIYFFFNSNVVISSAVIIGIVWLLFKIMVNFNIFALSTPNETYTPSPNT